MDNMGNGFEEKKIKKAIIEAKIKSILKIVIILTLVLSIGGYINILFCIKYNNKFYEQKDAQISLSVPNGYISKVNDNFGILGGSGNYKIAKNIGGKPVILEEGYSYFGIIHPVNYTRVNGGGHHLSGEFPVSIWENGYKKMRFFHPDIKYNKYQNDLDNISNIPDGKVIEMAISFDKPYKITDLYLLQNKLMPARATWIWLDEFTKEQREEFDYEIQNYDSEANGINDSSAIGMEVYNDTSSKIKKVYDLAINKSQYNEEYDKIIDNLSKSYTPDHKQLYKEMIENGKTSYEDAKVLGVVVHGTKEEIESLKDNPIIKSTVFGVVTDPVY